MARLNSITSRAVERTHEGAPARTITPAQQLRRSLMACMLWEKEFYEDGQAIAERIRSLVAQVEPETVATMAIEARTDMKLRHAPLLVAREMARLDTHKGLVARVLPQIVQRADELSEFLAIYWKDRPAGSRKREPLSAQVKKGLALAYARFDEYQISKYDREGAVRLKDVLRLVHPRAPSAEQGELWGRLIKDELKVPDTWEVSLSRGADKRETFERLIAERKLGGLALLRNLRNMEQAGVSKDLIREALAQMRVDRILPYRFITAARYAPALEPELEAAMFRSLEVRQKLRGKTGLLIDVSGSMDQKLSAKSETTRMDAACGLAVMARELCEEVEVFTFSNSTVAVPPRRGFALRDAIVRSQPHSSTYLGAAVSRANLAGVDRLLVFTDEQSHDAVPNPNASKAYMVNVASARNGVGYGRAWTHLDGFSEAVLSWIQAYEKGV